MKKLLFIAILIEVTYPAFSQAYIPMAFASGAMWRYRTIEIETSMTITDFMLFMDGTDTVSLGNTYHVIKARNRVMDYPIGAVVPVEPDTATISDVYFGAVREEGKKVYQLGIINEQLLFDFNVHVGDSVPSYTGKVRVNGIDSVVISGAFHKRYLTADPGFQVIEGVGSSRGLIPALNDGSGLINFYCFSYDSVLYRPDSTIPCTYIYPLMLESGIASVEKVTGVEFRPNPAFGIVHIFSSFIQPVQIGIYNSIGSLMVKEYMIKNSTINVASWPRGVYYVKYSCYSGTGKVERLVIN